MTSDVYLINITVKVNTLIYYLYSHSLFIVLLSTQIMEFTFKELSPNVCSITEFIVDELLY